MVNKIPEKSLLSTRVFYLIMVLFHMFTAIFCDTKFSRAIKNFNFLYILLISCSELITIYYLLTCGNDPGYVEETSS